MFGLWKIQNNKGSVFGSTVNASLKLLLSSEHHRLNSSHLAFIEVERVISETDIS